MAMLEGKKLLITGVVNQDARTVCRARVEVLWRRDREPETAAAAVTEANGFVPIPL